MEGLIVIVLFVIFSIIKQLLEKGKAPVPREGRKDSPYPWEEDMPVPWERGKGPQKVPGEEIKKEVPQKERKREEAPSPGPYARLGSEIGTPESPERKKYPSRRKITTGLKTFKRDSLVQGVVFSEVLGLPRSRKPFPLRQFNKVYK